LHLGRPAEALKLLEATLAAYKANLGADSREALMCMHNLAVSYDDLGRLQDAFGLFETILAARKAKYGPEHPDTLSSMISVAESLVKLDRATEALPLIDECLRRAAGKVVDPRLIPHALATRMKHFQKQQDVAGCRATAEMWEKLNRSGVSFFFDAAWSRSVTAGVIRQTDNSANAANNFKSETDRAMVWLRKAVAAGFNDAARLTTDKAFDVLRDRDDFKMLRAELKADRGTEKK
jgi:hypothetical protein